MTTEHFFDFAGEAHREPSLGIPRSIRRMFGVREQAFAESVYLRADVYDAVYVQAKLGLSPLKGMGRGAIQLPPFPNWLVPQLVSLPIYRSMQLTVGDRVWGIVRMYDGSCAVLTEPREILPYRGARVLNAWEMMSKEQQERYLHCVKARQTTSSHTGVWAHVSR